jgi:hypothetical protein
VDFIESIIEFMRYSFVGFSGKTSSMDFNVSFVHYL